MLQHGKYRKLFIPIPLYQKFLWNLPYQLINYKFMDRSESMTKEMIKEGRHIKLGLTNDDVIEMYKTMMLARKIDERMWLLNRAGKVPFVVSCQGQEAAQIGRASCRERV